MTRSISIKMLLRVPPQSVGELGGRVYILNLKIIQQRKEVSENIVLIPPELLDELMLEFRNVFNQYLKKLNTTNRNKRSILRLIQNTSKGESKGSCNILF